MCQSCRHHHRSLVSQRAFSASAPSLAASHVVSTLFPAPAEGASPRRARSSSTPIDGMDAFSPFLQSTKLNPPIDVRNMWKDVAAESASREGGTLPLEEPYHLNVYAHKHNTHITFTEPSRNPILSFSCGQLGLKKAQRGTYDAAFQLSTYTMRKMVEKAWRVGGTKMTSNAMRTLRDVRTAEKQGFGIEVVLGGFGPGREAFQKALLSPEGSFVKPLVVKVTDGTRLKFGGTRSPQVRRL